MSYDSLLISRCTIQRATKAQDAVGGTVHTWADHLVDIKCRRILYKMRDRVIADQDTAAYTDRFYVKSNQDIQVDDRVVFDGRTYDVLGINDGHEMGVVFFLRCRRTET